MTSALFAEVLTFLKASSSSVNREKALGDFADMLMDRGRGKEIVIAAFNAAWKATTPEDRLSFHPCEAFVKTGVCQHCPDTPYVEGNCENCGYYKCSPYCVDDHKFWSHPGREMYMCQDCKEYTCEMEKSEHSKTCEPKHTHELCETCSA